MADKQPSEVAFEKWWAGKVAEGYQYGREPLANVRFGFEAGFAARDGWLPIESAPKDGTEILLGHGNSVWVDEWIGGGHDCWMMCDQWETPEVPTHWMPLPPPPDSEATKDK